MESDLIELSRYRDTESVSETKGLLEAANISCRVGSTATNFDITTIGSGSDPEVIISVRRDDYLAARSAMEEAIPTIDLPDDHYLLTSSDEELIEILGKPGEWSPLDVAHARRLAKDRGIDEVDIEKKKNERMERLQRGKSASNTLLFFGWLFSVLGVLIGLGLIGVGIAWSLCFMKEKTPEGEFFTFDARSREIGKSMFFVACVTTGIALFLWLSIILSY